MTLSCPMSSYEFIRTEKSFIQSVFLLFLLVPWISSIIPWINKPAPSRWLVVSYCRPVLSSPSFLPHSFFSLLLLFSLPSCFLYFLTDFPFISDLFCYFLWAGYPIIRGRDTFFHEDSGRHSFREKEREIVMRGVNRERGRRERETHFPPSFSLSILYIVSIWIPFAAWFRSSYSFSLSSLLPSFLPPLPKHTLSFPFTISCFCLHFLIYCNTSERVCQERFLILFHWIIVLKMKFYLVFLFFSPIFFPIPSFLPSIHTLQLIFLPFPTSRAPISFHFSFLLYRYPDPLSSLSLIPFPFQNHFSSSSLSPFLSSSLYSHPNPYNNTLRHLEHRTTITRKRTLTIETFTLFIIFFASFPTNEIMEHECGWMNGLTQQMGTPQMILSFYGKMVIQFKWQKLSIFPGLRYKTSKLTIAPGNYLHLSKSVPQPSWLNKPTECVEFDDSVNAMSR